VPMTPLKLRTQLFLANLIIIVALTGALLLLVRSTVEERVGAQVRSGAESSVQAFEAVEHQREQQLSSAAALLADLPTLKSLMTTEHALTIQDASTAYWRLAQSDLFALATPDKKLVALDLTKPGWPKETVEREFRRSMERTEESSWWGDDGRLYWVFVRPITVGAGDTLRLVGMLAVGYQVDASVASQLSLVTGNQIALVTGDRVIASTLPADDEAALQHAVRAGEISTTAKLMKMGLARDQYVLSSIVLRASPAPGVRCFVLMPMAGANSFLRSLSRTIYLLGGFAVLASVLLFGFLARTITRPLDELVSGVRALTTGDYNYSISPRGSNEVVELSTAFSQMRGELLSSQQQRIEAERVAAVARAASSISHDLRHYLAAIVANAEFLYEAESMPTINKGEVYQEIRTASDQMTDLIDSLRELSYRRSPHHPQPMSVAHVVCRSIDAIHAKPEHRHTRIVSNISPEIEGVFDPKKLERAFFNLILNACEATNEATAEIVLEGRLTETHVEIRVKDNGRGIPASIRETLFDPFVSFGKPNGTGVGLAIVSKIVSDHGGTVCVEQTSETGTTVLMKLPRSLSMARAAFNSIAS
jgi:signal transduction histidine kinase